MKYIILFIGFLFFNGIYAQDLKKHRWENRVLLILSNESSKLNSNKIITNIEKDTFGLKERRLIIYKILPHFFTLDNKMTKNKTLYKSFNPENSDLKFILIGLDGGVKLDTVKPITKMELFSIIDGMPMRRSELKGN